MAHYIHHLPGRLRIKSHHLKRNEVRASSVRELLLNYPGVMSAQVNTVTGSLLIIYDKDVTCPRQLLDTLKRAGCCADSVQLPDGVKTAVERASTSPAGAGDAVGKAVVGVLVEKVVERSAFALIGAIL